jgi:hypothetical protein
MTTIKEMNDAVKPYGLEVQKFKWGFQFKAIDPAYQERCENASFALQRNGQATYFYNIPDVRIEDVIENAERLSKKMAELPAPKITRVITLEGCTDCPILQLADGQVVVQLTCRRIGRSEIVRGGSAQKEIDILSDWFKNVCDLPEEIPMK